MADQTATPKKKSTASSPTAEERWRSGRSRFSLLQFWKGEDREWYFSGQQKGEEVRLVVRKHWWFLLQPALPLLGCTLALFVILWVSIAFPGGGAIWYLLEGAAFLGMIVTGVLFAYKDLVVWWYDTYIITNKRIINARGLLEPTRKITPLDKVQQVGLDMDSIWGLFVGFGTVHVYLTGDQLLMRNCPNPRKVRDAIVGIADEISSSMKKKGGPPPPPSHPKDRDLLAVIDKLAKERPVPKLPDPDEHLPPLRNSERYRGPRRTFGGILRIPCNVRYVAGEHTVKYVQRSQYVLLRNLLIPLLLLIVLLPVAILMPATKSVPSVLLPYWWSGSGLILVGILISMGLVYSNYADDVYIITNRRIIDVQRFFIFFFERHQEAEYKDIRGAKVKVGNVIERFLDVGDLTIETPGNNPNILLENVDHPFVLQDEISGFRSHKDKVDAANRENSEKKNLATWFNEVVTTLEGTVTSRGTPSLRDMDLLEAMGCAQELGFDVVVSEEAVDNPDIQPGCVVRQNPPPGTVMEKGSQIEVVLSRRLVPVD